MKKLLIFLFIIGSFLIAKSALATQYYVDTSCNTPGNGTTTTCDGNADDSWDNLSDATAAITAGDIATLRGGIASEYDDGADLAFTNDGTFPAPIKIERDYDNNWNDAWTSSSQTYTVTFGSNTWGGSASIGGLDTGDWIWVDDENNRLFAYEVASAAGTGGAEFTTYLPYKGNSAGTGLYLNKMTSQPYWGNSATPPSAGWNINNDFYWYFDGITVNSSDSTGAINIQVSSPTEFKNMNFKGGTTYQIWNAYTTSAYYASYWIERCRIVSGYRWAIYDGGGYAFQRITIKDSLLNPTGTNNAGIEFAANSFYLEIYDSTIGSATEYYGIKSSGEGIIRSRNTVFLGATGDFYVAGDKGVRTGYVEDYDGNFGKNIGWYGVNKEITYSNTTWVRAGGGSTSIFLASASTNLDTDWDFSKIQLFEYPIYADTTNKTYTMYFMATASAEFNVLPTAANLWIECEFYGETSEADRKLTKSTGTITADDGSWYGISVTCQPTQAGVLYLRGWYAKTKETGYDNELFMDVAPVISTP